MARGGCSEVLEQLVAMVPSMACGRAGVRLVDNGELGTCVEEMIPPLSALGVVEVDDRVGVYREGADSWGDALLKSARALGRDRHSTVMETAKSFDATFATTRLLAASADTLIGFNAS